MEEKLLTAEEYAEIENITLDDVFERAFDSRYKDYFITKDRKTFIKNTIFGKPKEEEQQPTEHAETLPEKPLDEVGYLRKQIEELQNEIREKDKQIIEMCNRFATLAENGQLLVSQAQILHATDKQLTAPKETTRTERENIFMRIFKHKKSGE